MHPLSSFSVPIVFCIFYYLKGAWRGFSPPHLVYKQGNKCFPHNPAAQIDRQNLYFRVCSCFAIGIYPPLNLEKGHRKTSLIQIKTFIFQFFFQCCKEIFLFFHCDDHAAFTNRKQNINGCSCSPFFKKDSSIAGVGAIFTRFPSVKSAASVPLIE